MIAISPNNYFLLTTYVGHAHNFFLWGFLYYAVFHYLIQERLYKTSMPKIEERKKLLICTWMMICWITTILFQLWLDMTYFPNPLKASL